MSCMNRSSSSHLSYASVILENCARLSILAFPGISHLPLVQAHSSLFRYHSHCKICEAISTFTAVYRSSIAVFWNTFFPQLHLWSQHHVFKVGSRSEKQWPDLVHQPKRDERRWLPSRLLNGSKNQDQGRRHPVEHPVSGWWWESAYLQSNGNCWVDCEEKVEMVRVLRELRWSMSNTFQVIERFMENSDFLSEVLRWAVFPGNTSPRDFRWGLNFYLKMKKTALSFGSENISEIDIYFSSPWHSIVQVDLNVKAWSFKFQ